MSEWLNYVKAYAAKNSISYKQALKEASPSYKMRNDVKPEPKQEEKAKRKYIKKKDEVGLVHI